MRIATKFGGGMAFMGEVCGAVTAALKVIGLRHEMYNSEDFEAKEKTCTSSQDFAERFTARNGSINCTELIGCDLSIKKGYERAIAIRCVQCSLEKVCHRCSGNF